MNEAKQFFLNAKYGKRGNLKMAKQQKLGEEEEKKY